MPNIIFVLHEVVISKQAYAQLLETLLSEQENTVFFCVLNKLLKLDNCTALLIYYAYFHLFFELGLTAVFWFNVLFFITNGHKFVIFVC